MLSRADVHWCLTQYSNKEQCELVGTVGQLKAARVFYVAKGEEGFGLARHQAEQEILSELFFRGIAGDV